MGTSKLTKTNAPGHDEPLIVREFAFVTEYLVDLNGTAALRRLGLGAAHPKQRAAELLARPRVQAAIQQALNERSKATEVTGERLRAHLASIAFAEPDGPITVAHQIEAAKQLAKMLGLTRLETTAAPVVAPIQFNITGGPPLVPDDSEPPGGCQP